jgi:hypothetical protein
MPLFGLRYTSESSRCRFWESLLLPQARIYALVLYAIQESASQTLLNVLLTDVPPRVVVEEKRPPLHHTSHGAGPLH